MNRVIKNPFERKQKGAVSALCIVCLLLAGNHSCQTMNTSSEEVIEPVLPDDVVNVFFEKQLPAFSGFRSECFFVGDKYKPNFEGDRSENLSHTVVINNRDEFKKSIYCSTIELPAIDFSSYTLIIGQYQMSGSGYRVAEQKIIVGPKRIELNIRVEVPEYSFAVICPVYYWGIYPKVKNKPISVNIYLNK